jgi:hypothetical protein
MLKIYGAVRHRPSQDALVRPDGILEMGFVDPPVRIISIPLVVLALDAHEARNGCRPAHGH